MDVTQRTTVRRMVPHGAVDLPVHDVAVGDVVVLSYGRQIPVERIESTYDPITAGRRYVVRGGPWQAVLYSNERLTVLQRAPRLTAG